MKREKVNGVFSREGSHRRSAAGSGVVCTSNRRESDDGRVGSMVAQGSASEDAGVLFSDPGKREYVWAIKLDHPRSPICQVFLKYLPNVFRTGSDRGVTSNSDAGCTLLSFAVVLAMCWRKAGVPSVTRLFHWCAPVPLPSCPFAQSWQRRRSTTRPSTRRLSGWWHGLRGSPTSPGPSSTRISGSPTSRRKPRQPRSATSLRSSWAASS